MRKSTKFILVIVGVLLGIIVLDTLQARILKHSPIISRRENIVDSWVDKGILIDTYYCMNEGDIVQVSHHLKTSKFTCSIKNTSSVKEIVDTTKDKEDFFCAEVLEKIYEDNRFGYYLPCLKSEYILVRYTDGTEEKLTDALEKGKINISDLDKFQIEYRKISYIDISVAETAIDNQLNTWKSADVENVSNPYSIYYHNIKKLTITLEQKKYDFIEALKSNIISIEEIIDGAKVVESFDDGGTTIYSLDGSLSFGDGTGENIVGVGTTFTIIKCNTLAGNQDIYIGQGSLAYEQSYCQ